MWKLNLIDKYEIDRVIIHTEDKTASIDGVQVSQPFINFYIQV